MNDKEIDPPLTAHQKKLVRGLTADELRKIDAALLSNIAPQWRKVARVVGTTMIELGPHRVAGVPDLFYAERVAEMVRDGILTSQGDLRSMRHSEVRIVGDSTRTDGLEL
jgi:hypothetical protein